MLRILLAMPHFYKSDPASEHGFGHDAPEKRAAIVSDCVRALRLTFSTPRTYSAFVSEADGHIYVRKFPADTWNACEIDLAICTTMGEDHVLPLLDVPENWYKQVKVVLDNPRHLPFGCLQYLRQHRGEYDYYGYLEDDCKITDPMFFQKLGWFESMFGPDAVLLPHRFCRYGYPKVQKIYGDPEMQENFIGKWMNYQRRPVLSAPWGGQVLHFRKPHNPHAGCFFLSAAQFERFCARKENFQPTAEFISPLESAATLTMMKTFDVYKPDFAQASFFEIEHDGVDKDDFPNGKQLL